MSRYYCKNCGSESIEGLTQKGDKALVLCNFCKKTNGITTKNGEYSRLRNTGAV